MQIGVGFPDRELGSDPAVITDWAQAVEDLGFEFVSMGEHVVLPDQSYHKGLMGPYSHLTIFREPMVMFGFLAAVTRSVEFHTGILILPQRQTALVAKQVAELDLLSRGRLVLGVGVGWNPVEYEALGEDFHTRGRRLEEQLELMHRLWTEPLVTFEGRFDTITQSALLPRPERRIPIWFGGMSSRALERTGRLGDGWAPNFRFPDDLERSVEDMLFRWGRIGESAKRAGRDPSEIGLRLAVGGGDVDQQVARARRWEELGATHCSLGTQLDASLFDSSAGISPEQHIAAMRTFMEAYKS